MMPLNCGVGQDSQESLGQQRDPTSLSQSSPEYSFEGLMLANIYRGPLKCWALGDSCDQGGSLSLPLQSYFTGETDNSHVKNKSRSSNSVMKLIRREQTRGGSGRDGGWR